MLIDTAGYAPDVAAAAQADAILTPCPARRLRLRLDSEIRSDCARVGQTLLVIIAAPVQGVETREAISAIEGQGVAVCPVILSRRKVFVARAHEGLTALDVEPNGKAAGEMREFGLGV